MTTQQGQPGTGWTVTDQQTEDKIGPGNQLQAGINVYFRTQYGANASVWLPRTAYSPESVRAAVTELATSLDSVHTLTG